MSSTITATDLQGSPLGVQTSPVLILGYRTRYESESIVHRLLDGDVAVIQYPGELRTGTLELFYTTETDAHQAATMHTLAGRRFDVTAAGRPTVDMTYAAFGVDVRLENTRAHWIVAIDYQEVTP